MGYASAVAWMLWSFWQHSAFLSEDERPAYLATLWETVDLATEFLAGWTDERTGAPLYSFATDTWRDTQSMDLLPAAHMGVSSAVEIAQALGQERPEWRRRQTELHALVNFHCRDSEGNWKLDEAYRYWPSAVIRVNDPRRDWPAKIISLEDPRWNIALERGFKALPDLHGYAAARTLCDVAMIAQIRPDARAKLRAVLKPTLQRALRTRGPNGAQTPIFPDAVNAALSYVAAMTVCGASP